MIPIAKNWIYDTMNGGGSGVVVIILIVGVLAWAVGKTQPEATQDKGKAGGTSGSAPNFNSTGTGFNPPPQSPPKSPPQQPKSSWQRPQSTPNPGQKSAWEKAREETRKREEEKKKAEEAKRKAEELEKRKQELEKEKQKQREKDTKERLEREKKARQEKEAKESPAKEKPSPTKRPPMPSARTEDDAASDAYSFRPYDRPKHKANSGASVYSESSYAPSQSTARTTPPPSMNGPYTTTDADKIMIKGVYSFNNAFMRTPVAQLVSGQKPVTDGLILRMASEGLFIDDDRRKEAQREWDVKVWTMKLVEVCLARQSYCHSCLTSRTELRDCWSPNLASIDP